MHHPIAHVINGVKAAAAALLGATSWEGYKFVASVRTAAEGVVMEAGIAAESTIIEMRELVSEVGLTAGDAIRTGRMMLKAVQKVLARSTRTLMEFAPPYHALVVIIFVFIIYEMRQRLGEASNPGPDMESKLREALLAEKLRRSFEKEEEEMTRRGLRGTALGRPPVLAVGNRGDGPKRSNSREMYLGFEELKEKVVEFKNRQEKMKEKADAEKTRTQQPEKFSIGSPLKSPGGSVRSLEETPRHRTPDRAEKEPMTDEPHVGVVVQLLDAVKTQDAAILLIEKAQSWIRVYGYSFDREEFAEALMNARKRGVDVMIGVDRKFSLNGRSREQLGVIKTVATNGVVVTMVGGFPLREEYQAVGRSLAFDGNGNLHAKVVHTDAGTVLGSCNWTTSSRCNVELGVELRLGENHKEKLKQEMTTVIFSGKTIQEAEVSNEQWNMVATHMRGRGPKWVPW